MAIAPKFNIKHPRPKDIKITRQKTKHVHFFRIQKLNPFQPTVHGRYVKIE